MPEALEKLKKKIWEKLKGKINPRTKKPYTESEAWAIATTVYKKSGGKLMQYPTEVISLKEDAFIEQELISQVIKELEGR